VVCSAIFIIAFSHIHVPGRAGISEMATRDDEDLNRARNKERKKNKDEEEDEEGEDEVSKATHMSNVKTTGSVRDIISISNLFY
jgi:hypothetical protein